ncbi:MAG TPA: hypothetical protein VFE50_13400, partial [Cyclobacteriaceae bacterium]|nr:hypothetical protein [Cyclobacteriaceae bacterium]
MKSLLLYAFLLCSVVAQATHLRGGQIRVVSVNGLNVTVELRVITDTGSEIKVGEGNFDFGDGTTVITETKENTRIDSRLGIGLVVYTLEHTYASVGTYRLSYTEPNLTGGILNITNSIETRFYIESQVVLTGPGQSPTINFPTDPIFVCPTGREYVFSTAAIDDSSPNDFYYTYELPTPSSNVKGYKLPENLSINKENGLIKWDTKFNGQQVVGLIWILVRVNKFSKTKGFMASVWRAIQITVEDSTSKIDMTNSVTEDNNKLLVTEGKEKKVKVILSEVNSNDSLYLDVYFNKAIRSNISINKRDSIAGNMKFKIAMITLKTTSNIVSEQPYPVTVSGRSKYRVDFTFLYNTKEPTPDPIVTGVLDQEYDAVY